MNIEEIRNHITQGDYEISVHAEKERYAEEVSLTDIEAAILNGEVLEDYLDDPRGESCLILGYSRSRAIHIVCGYTSVRSLRIITVYLPKPSKWLNDRTRRQTQGGNHA
jgi:hypothetical protein